MGAESRADEGDALECTSAGEEAARAGSGRSSLIAPSSSDCANVGERRSILTRSAYRSVLSVCL